ncbi:MAG: FAD-binding protein [Lachnospiraceae bacterium]|nr:FAD-binding protein [Lachnospiraceae bacterium]
MKIEYRLKTDVLVVGMGGAGIRAAIESARGGADTVLLGKAAFGRTGATFYPGTNGWGVQAVLFEGDSEEHFLEEILDAGAGCADPKLARVLAYGATERFHELEEMGLHFERHEDGTYKSVIPCFGKRLRGSSTLGLGKIRLVMWKQLMKAGVSVLENAEILHLVKKDGAVVGAVGLDALDVPFYIAAKAVVLATGGGCGIYKYSLATPDETGDGYQLALDAGARLINPEMIQFIPGLTKPVKKLLFQEKNLTTCPKFLDKNGKDILPAYLPEGLSEEECLTIRAKHGPFTTADQSFYVDYAMYEEAAKGNATESGGIHISYAPEVAYSTDWTVTDWLKWMHERGVDPVGEGFDMIPHAQCFNGGIYIDEKAYAGVPGLYAAGETAGGPHGADRLGGAAMAATQVFGKLAGENAAAYAKEANLPEISDMEIEAQLDEKFGRPEGELIDMEAAMEEIREIMWLSGAIVRNEERVRYGLSRIAAIEERFSPALQLEKGGRVKAVNDLISYITTAKVLLTVIDARKESRGPHYRSDYPAKDPAYEGAMTVRKENGGFTVELVQF